MSTAAFTSTAERLKLRALTAMALTALAAAVFAVLVSGGASPAEPVPAGEAEATPAPAPSVPAAPVPSTPTSTPAPPVSGTGECGAALETMRSIMGTPVHDPSIESRWSEVNDTMAEIAGRCDAETTAAFERDEFAPWAGIDPVTREPLNAPAGAGQAPTP